MIDRRAQENLGLRNSDCGCCYIVDRVGLNELLDEPEINTSIGPMTDAPQQLLAVVEEVGERKRRWFRWAYDGHTVAPWQLMGAVHVHDEEPDFCRWEDLPMVNIVSDGVPVCGCSSCGGPREPAKHA